MVMSVRAIREERTLRLEQAQPDLAQGLAVLLFPRFARDKIDLGPLPQRAVGFLIIGLPLLVRNLGQGGGQLRAPLGTDSKANAPPRLLGSVRMFEPAEQAVLVAGGVAAKIAQETGGRVINVRNEKDLEKAFDIISEELRSQYVLGYYPANVKRDGTFRKIKVEASRPDVKILARKGYYAPFQ